MSQFHNSPYSPPNPYGQPQFGSQPIENPMKTQCMTLGIILIVLAILGLLFSVASSVSNILQISNGVQPPPNMQKPEEITGFYAGFYGAAIVTGLSVLLQPIILWGGISFVKGKNITGAKMGAICATIPCLSSCCILGVPFGIWGLMLLSNPLTKQLFQQNFNSATSG